MPNATSTRDSLLVKYIERVKFRDRKHGNWRQIYLDCLGVCQFPLPNGGVCGETDGLEFHEQFGENKGKENRFQERVLLCNYHHWSIHGEKWVNKRHYPSMLQIDVNIEILLAGGLSDWITHYKLVEREVHYDITMDNTADKVDLDNSENS